MAKPRIGSSVDFPCRLRRKGVLQPLVAPPSICGCFLPSTDGRTLLDRFRPGSPQSTPPCGGRKKRIWIGSVSPTSFLIPEEPESFKMRCRIPGQMPCVCGRQVLDRFWTVSGQVLDRFWLPKPLFGSSVDFPCCLRKKFVKALVGITRRVFLICKS